MPARWPSGAAAAKAQKTTASRRDNRVADMAVPRRRQSTLNPPERPHGGRRLYCAPMRLLVALAIVSSGACGLSAQTPRVADTADLIVHHGVVYTVADAAPRAQAVAIAGDRLIYVGSDAEALARRGPSTRVIDAGGRAILPGLHDAHGHVLGLGAQLQELDLRGTTSLVEVTAKLAERAR